MKPGLPNVVATKAMTLIEVLVVISIIVVVLVFTAIPVNRDTKSKAVVCTSNLKEVFVGFWMWRGDHENKFPWQISVTNGGTRELISNGQAFNHFLALSNCPIQPKRFICPTDNARHVADSYESFSNQNLSYFVGLLSMTNSSTISILAGDRHLQAEGKPLKPGLFALTRNMTMGWTHELHSNKGSATKGVLVFADGHAETCRNPTDVFRGQNPPTNLLVIP